jgi:hypothetical protein
MNAVSPVRRAGLTAVELLMAVATLAMVLAAAATLSSAVHVGYEHSHGVGTATQHARVALDYIRRMVVTAQAADDDPGVAVIESWEGSWRFPDVLVVWSPESAPANSQGPPLLRELLVIGPDPRDPRQLVAVRDPSDAQSAPLAELNTGTWPARFQSLLGSSTAKRVVLSDRLHTAVGPSGTTRGAVRFELRLAPTAAEWNAYRAGTLAWNDLPWPLGWYSRATGMRQAWVRMELQLSSGERPSTNSQPPAMPFFGSAALYYELQP